MSAKTNGSSGLTSVAREEARQAYATWQAEVAFPAQEAAAVAVGAWSTTPVVANKTLRYTSRTSVGRLIELCACATWGS